LGRVDFVACEQCLQLITRGELLHADGVVNCLAPASDVRTAVDSNDWHDVEVEPRYDATVEAQLFFAQLSTSPEHRRIEEGELQWLLDLVRVGSCEDDPGDMGLAQLYRANGMRVGGRVRQVPLDAPAVSRKLLERADNSAGVVVTAVGHLHDLSESVKGHRRPHQDHYRFGTGLLD
jgi:hypothetical protein